MNKPFAARLTAALKLLASAFSLLCLSMTKASRYAQMATCIIALLSMATVTSVMAAAQKPNVLFISVDDLNDWVGYLGGHAQASTPNIDALAEQGAAFTHAYSSATACGPSRTALMYGSYPHRSGSYGHHKVYSPAQLLAKDRLPLNLVFQQNGYYTAGAGKIFHFEEKRGWHNYQKKFKGIKTKNEALGNNISLEIGVQQTDNDSDTSDGQMTDWVINELQRKHDKPFFIALGLKKPHLPFVAPRKYFAQHDLKTIKLPVVPAGDLDDLSQAGRLFSRATVGWDDTNHHKAILEVPGAWQKLVRAYLAASSFADANVGRLLAALQSSPYLDNTIVVLWGDHGWHLGEKSHWKKMTLWERGTKTPFIIKMPGGKANGMRIDAPVSLQDIFPTLVDLCELKVDQQLDGNSLKPLLEDPATIWDKPALMTHGPGNFAVRQGPWRLIRYADGSEEFYNIKQDPQELTNLANSAEYAAQLGALQQHVPKTWRYILGPRFKKFSGAFSEAPAAQQ